MGVRSDCLASVPSGAFATATLSAIGVWGVVEGAGAGSLTGIVGAAGSPSYNASSGGALTNAYSFYAAGVVYAGSGTLTNAYGFFAADQTATTTLSTGSARCISTGSGAKYNLYMSGSAANYPAGYLGVGVLPSTTQAISATVSSVSHVGIAINAAASQSVNLAEFLESGGMVLVGITSGGRLTFNATGTASTNTTTPAAWLDILVGGTEYKLLLYC